MSAFFVYKIYPDDFRFSRRFPGAMSQPSRFAAAFSTNANPAGVAAFHFN